VGTWILDPATGATWLSPELRGLLGLAESDLFAAVHPDDRDYLRRELAAAVALERDLAVELRVLRPDTGALGWVELRGQAGRDAVRGLAVDVTSRKRAELALREREQLFARAFAKNPNPMTVNLLPSFTYVEVN